ncbi:alpha/beta fold hydrolase [Phenylobacterium montanum]|uniref:Alpha/beta fold hydrolase n=1 Tax=Phenylobacterium montanum TaxID=2823693 RepID=A0A975FY90_9CAUL|nr:alpha/beta fold hydrolase [Caulobacter sp. S6]QUD87053.1 alpha/beta fold hydrolase [Caulobacter sp. S6]
MRRGSKILAGLILAILAYIAAGGALVAAEASHPMRGRLVDIGGRRMHLVCEGERNAEPTVLFEAGAFGFSADWGVVQDRVTAQGLHTCSYDRAGLGLSDPGPGPRDGLAAAKDLEALLKAAGEDGPFIMVGHSMAGTYMPLFAARNHDRIRGLVFIDAAPPEAIDQPQVRAFVEKFAAASRWAARGARIGLYQPLAGTWFGDKIGLTPVASAEKRRAFASPTHNRWASAEVDQWMNTAAEAKAAGPLDPAWPVAVITAGPVAGREAWKDLQATPARRSQHGYIDHVAAASHATLLGVSHADSVVRGVTFVRQAVAGQPESPPQQVAQSRATNP